MMLFLLKILSICNEEKTKNTISNHYLAKNDITSIPFKIDLIIFNCIFDSIEATEGGVIRLRNQEQHSFKVNQCKFLKCHGPQSGTIYVEGQGALMTMDSLYMESCSSDSYGGIMYLNPKASVAHHTFTKISAYEFDGDSGFHFKGEETDKDDIELNYCNFSHGIYSYDSVINIENVGCNIQYCNIEHSNCYNYIAYFFESKTKDDVDSIELSNFIGNLVSNYDDGAVIYLKGFTLDIKECCFQENEGQNIFYAFWGKITAKDCYYDSEPSSKYKRDESGCTVEITEKNIKTTSYSYQYYDGSDVNPTIKIEPEEPIEPAVSSKEEPKEEPEEPVEPAISSKEEPKEEPEEPIEPAISSKEEPIEPKEPEQSSDSSKDGNMPEHADNEKVDKNKSSGKSIGIGIGVSIALIVIIVAITLFVIMKLRRKNGGDYPESDEDMDSLEPATNVIPLISDTEIDTINLYSTSQFNESDPFDNDFEEHDVVGFLSNQVI